MGGWPHGKTVRVIEANPRSHQGGAGFGQILNHLVADHVGNNDRQIWQKEHVQRPRNGQSDQWP